MQPPRCGEAVLNQRSATCTASRREAATLTAALPISWLKYLIQKTKPLVYRLLFKNALPPQGIVHKRGGHEIASTSGRATERYRRLFAGAGNRRVLGVNEHFAPSASVSTAARALTGHRRNRERCFFFETGEAHTLETLQDQIRCAIAASDTRAN